MYKNLYEPRSKKNICTSRSFGKMLTEKNEISMAVANYASLCAAKLRRQNSCCQQLQVFLQTNPHNRHDKQYSMSITIQLQTASNTSNDIIKYAIKGLDIIFSPGYRYMKCGVIVTDFVPENTIQSNLFSGTNKKSNTLMKAMDNVNKTFGNEIVRTASQGFDRRYILRAEFLSPCYTTNLQDILKVKI